MADARRVLTAWIVVPQLLAFPILAFGTMVVLLHMRGSDTRVPVVLALPFLVEGAIAFASAVVLRERLKDRLTFSPFAVALGSCIGLFVGTLLVGTLALAWQRSARGLLAPGRFVPIAVLSVACGLAVGSSLGVWAGSRQQEDRQPGE